MTQEVDMAGRGPAPKPVGRRARSNADPKPMTVLRFEHASAPELPDDIEWMPYRITVLLLIDLR